MEWTQQNISKVEDATFARARGGYEEEAVDNFLDHVAACQRAGQRIPDPRPVVFPVARLRTGYRTRDVDALMFVLADWYDRQAQQQLSPPPPPVPVQSGQVRLRWSQNQLDWVRETSFAVVGRGRARYNQTEVDDFLDEVLVAMGHGQRLPDVVGARFNPSKAMRRGYDAQAVDQFLDQLMRQRPLEDDDY